MKKWLIGLALLALFAAALLYWHRVSAVNTQLERLAGELAPYGQLSWESVVVDPRGRALIGQVAFQPHQETDTIRARSITLRSRDLIGLYPATSNRISLTMPQLWSLDLDGLRLPIGLLVSDWSLENLGLLLPFRARACAGLEQPVFGDLLELGYGRLELDVEFAVEAERDSIHLDLSLNARGLSEIRQRWDLGVVEPIAELNDLLGILDNATLRAVDYQIQDRGLLRRLDANCAVPPDREKSNLESVQFQAWLRAWTDLGLEPGGIAQAAFRHHLKQPTAAISIVARPERELLLSDLRGSFDPTLIRAMNLRVAIADGPAIPLDLRAVTPTLVIEPPAAEPDTSEMISILKSEDKTESTIVVGRPRDWERIELDRISEHIGNRVRVDFIDGTQVSGRIASLEEGRLQLLTQSRMGEFSRPILLSDIASVEVKP